MSIIGPVVGPLEPEKTAAPRHVSELLRVLGPGLVVAATGVGAGDLVAAAEAGSRFGLTLLWCAAVGAALKLALNEGVARWQLATGTTLLEGWVRHFGRPLQAAFLAYLVVWTFVVSAALMTACGLAGHALLPAVSVNAWAGLHGLVGLVFVWLGAYGVFERAMKVAIGLMFLALVGSAVLQPPPAGAALSGLLVPTVPAGGMLRVLGVIGGVGGTLTLLAYNYWVREKGWTGVGWLRAVRWDLTTGYLLTGLFGLAVVSLAGTVLLPRGMVVEGSGGVLRMAAMLSERFGHAGELVFLGGFWGAVASSLLGVWQGVPYLFADFVGLLRGAGPGASVSRTGGLYRGYLLFMTFPPMALFLLGRPVWLIVAYAALGALFMPFLAAALLYLNNRRDLVGELHNRWLANLAGALALVLFAALGVRSLVDLLVGR